MREMRRRMQILYSRFFISSNLLSLKDGGRHPTTEHFLQHINIKFCPLQKILENFYKYFFRNYLYSYYCIFNDYYVKNCLLILITFCSNISMWQESLHKIKKGNT